MHELYILEISSQESIENRSTMESPNSALFLSILALFATTASFVTAELHEHTFTVCFRNVFFLFFLFHFWRRRHSPVSLMEPSYGRIYLMDLIPNKVPCGEIGESSFFFQLSWLSFSAMCMDYDIFVQTDTTGTSD